MNIRRLNALMRKEALQIIRDPSSILIAAVLPLLLIFIFAFAVSLDVNELAVGIAVEDDSPEAAGFVEAFTSSRYFKVRSGPRSPRTRSGADGGGYPRHRRHPGRLRFPARQCGGPGGAGADHHRRQRTEHRELRAELCTRRLAGLAAAAGARRRPRRAGAGDGRRPGLVQPGAREPQFPAARGAGADHDADRHAADCARRGARVGARHDGSAAFYLNHARGTDPRQAAAVFPARDALAVPSVSAMVRCFTCRCAARFLFWPGPGRCSCSRRSGSAC